jgi:hypothetical protein
MKGRCSERVGSRAPFIPDVGLGRRLFGWVTEELQAEFVKKEYVEMHALSAQAYAGKVTR